MKVYLLESVNPVYRRHRLANVLATARKYKGISNHWADVTNKLADKRVYGMPNDAYAKHVGRATSAEDSHFRYLRKYQKALRIAQGRYELPSGHNKYRMVPSNPLRKNRDDSLGRHNISVKDMLATRKRDKARKN